MSGLEVANENVTSQASAVAAGAVVASAFHQRANFYSAMVHLAQSSLSLMIIVNLIFLVYGFFMYGLQRLCFGQLRPVEIEQLYEKGWFAVTETCLAMTIFREEVGAFFLVMFTALVTAKVWGWIGEGRVEVLEQQPPANPRLFHTRLSISLILSLAYNIWLLNYAVNTVVQQARPTMMVMFLFEFAVQTVSSFHTACRYIISLVEARVVKQQTAQRLEDRRRQVREQRAEILRRRETEGATETETEAAEPLPSEDDVDEMDIEVPGWESKGQWVLGLDLLADFVKMGIYTAFFCVLFTFYGLPIHIMRDVFMTTRSFVKRLHALLRYRQALRDMNKYPDATAEELGREDTCIICREEMQPWDAANPGQVERSRPKKLPCGHILHFGCLKSWLERQQVCPTCRRSVVMDAPAPDRNGDPMVFRFGLNFPARNPGQQPPANGAAPGGAQVAPGVQGVQNGGQNDQQGNGNGRVRMFNFGPVRIGFAQGDEGVLRDMAQQMGVPPNVANPQAAAQDAPAQDQDTNGVLNEIRHQLADVNQRVASAGQRVQQDMQQLQNAEAQLSMMNILLQEMARLNHIGEILQQQQRPAQQYDAESNGPQIGPFTQPPVQGQPPQFQPLQHAQPYHYPVGYPGHFPQLPYLGHLIPAPRPQPPNVVTRHGGASFSAAIPAGSPDLPPGVVIPPGWSLLPLQPLDGGTQPVAPVPSVSQVQDLRPGTTAGPVQSQFMNDFAALQASRRETRSAPASGLTAPAHHSTDQEQRGRSPPVPSSSHAAEGPRAETPQVTAPTPVLPNWGGPAQLFGRGNMGARDTAASPVTQEQPHDEDTTEQNGSSNVIGGTTKDKGKAKAVTVEDDQSESDT
ncbi:hypothetical protein CONLIGDRAFT_669351 [Coniochaeta ligniaria NRRL 30616]|uniref:RING-type E3 ubiquitin transferase n=1 Tax=Coniochaeta ligniaria NRRL 30616 TaxID=1408157 RepID=A0A1J7J867_9PEZI|nr:hypothetical protein CONLIGDRAFT_669351 [Coniochaeta ligniaria NRRL 30616]